MPIKLRRPPPKPKRRPGERANLRDETVANELAKLVALDPNKVTLGALARGLGVTLNTVRARFQTVERAMAWLIHRRIEAAVPQVNFGETPAAHLQRLLTAVVSAFPERQVRLWAGMVLTPQHGLPPELCEGMLRCLEGMGADDKTLPAAIRYLIVEIMHSIALPDATASGISAIIVTAGKRGVGGEFPRLDALAAQLESRVPEADDDPKLRIASIVSSVGEMIKSGGAKAQRNA